MLSLILFLLLHTSIDNRLLTHLDQIEFVTKWFRQIQAPGTIITTETPLFKPIERTIPKNPWPKTDPGSRPALPIVCMIVVELVTVKFRTSLFDGVDEKEDRPLIVQFCGNDPNTLVSSVRQIFSWS